MTPRTSKYISLHQWLKYHYGKATYCSNNPNHKAKRFEWANITGIYEKNIKNFIQLCPSCHRKLDWTKEQSEKIRVRSLGNHYRARMIRQFNLSGKLIKEWDSITVASRELNILGSSIANNLSGRSKKAGGFIWV